MKISVVGLGYVGTVAAAGLSNAGHQVVGIDIDRRRVDGQPVVRTCVQRCWRRTETPFRYPPRVRTPLTCTTPVPVPGTIPLTWRILT